MDKVSFCIITKAKDNFLYPSTIVTVKIEFPFLIYFSNKIRKVNVNLLSHLAILRKYENSWQGGTDERSSLRFIKKVF